MLTAVALPLGGLALLAVVWVFFGLERRDRPEVVLAVVVGAVLLQALLYTSDQGVPVGPFRPGPARLPELLIGAALVARFLARGAPTRISAAAMAWTAFLVWYGSSAIVGFLEGNPTDVIVFEARAILYVGGCAILAAGVTPGRLVTKKLLGSWFVVLGTLGAVMVTLSFLGLTPPLDVPLLRVPSLGGLGADAASLLILIGAIGLLVELTYARRRRRVLIATIPMGLAWMAGLQRASVVNFAVVLTVLCLVAAGSTWSRRIRATPTELGLFVAAAVAIGVLATLSGARSGDIAVPFELGDRIESAFTGVGNTNSAGARLNKYDEGNDLIAERPVMGWGLAKQITSFYPGINGGGRFGTTAVFDSVPYDLVVRTGAVGLLLFLIAMALSLRDGLRAWVRHPDNAVAALGMGAFAGAMGLLGKGLVESVLDKVVLACALGVLVGIMAAAASDRTRARPVLRGGVAERGDAAVGVASY